MFNKDLNSMPYNREHYTFAESLYNNYVKMRKSTSDFENIKYTVKDSFIDSKEGKEGFIAGVYVMLSLIADM